MSALIAVAATVAATPVPSPSPEVIVKTVQVVPDWYNQLAVVLKQGAELGLFVIPGVVASKLHDFANPKLGVWGNALLLFAYSIVLGLLGLIAAGSLNLLTVEWNNPAMVGTAILTVLGAASARYAAYKARTQDSPAPTVTTVPVASTSDF
jgi:hypothetical protein